MDLDTFIISVFCRRHRSYRSRGPAPKLSDSEVITMEIVTESLGIDTDNGIYTYFKRHYPHYFPKMREIHRTTFTPQAANLWVIKEMLWQHLLTHELVVLGQDEEPLLVIDSFPIPICKKSRSYRCNVMRELSERGRDTILGKFLGMRAHVVVVRPGIIVRANVCGADVHDHHLAERLLEGMGQGWVLADRNHWSPHVREQLQDYEGGPTLLARFKLKNQTEKQRGAGVAQVAICKAPEDREHLLSAGGALPDEGGLGEGHLALLVALHP